MFISKAVCSPHTYHYRIQKIGLPSLVARYVLPTLIVSILLNLPRILVNFFLGNLIQVERYLFLLYSFYQVNKLNEKKILIPFLIQIFHPIISTAIFPTVILLIININMYSKIPLRRVTSTSSY